MSDGRDRVVLRNVATSTSNSSSTTSTLFKRVGGTRSWLRVAAETGASSAIEVDKATMMRRCDLPARDLRLLDPLFVYPSTILGREHAIVVNLERVRCIITADEAFILRTAAGGGGVDVVDQYARELQRRIAARAEGLPFEFLALELALEFACSHLDAEVSTLEVEAYPLLDELTSKLNTLNLEQVRHIKSMLLALTRRVQKVRDEIEQLMDDDGDMAEMYLTEKKLRVEAALLTGQSLNSIGLNGPGLSLSAPVSPSSSPPATATWRLEKNLSFARSRHDGSRSSKCSIYHIEELEMLLEAYFVVIDNTLNKLTSLKEYIDDTEDFINIQLDNVRNQLIQFELLLTTATFIVAIFSVVAGVFGMNFVIPLFDDPSMFLWVILITGVCGILIFCSFLWYFRRRRLIPL